MEPEPEGGTNIFTGKDYSALFSNLKYDQTVNIHSTDLPYFAVLSYRDKDKGNRPDPLNGSDFEGIFKDISDDGWALLDLKEDSSHLDKEEFSFLKALGLGLQIDQTYYVNKFAYILYDPKDGLFRNYDNGWSPQDKKLQLRAFMRLARTYILPGYWWLAFYARQYLPDTIGFATMLNTNLLEIEHEWDKLPSV
jgi:hypothetical protein